MEGTGRIPKNNEHIGIAHGRGLPSGQGAKEHDRQHLRVFRQLFGVGPDTCSTFCRSSRKNLTLTICHHLLGDRHRLLRIGPGIVFGGAGRRGAR